MTKLEVYEIIYNCLKKEYGDENLNRIIDRIENGYINLNDIIFKTEYGGYNKDNLYIYKLFKLLIDLKK